MPEKAREIQLDEVNSWYRGSMCCDYVILAQTCPECGDLARFNRYFIGADKFKLLSLPCIGTMIDDHSAILFDAIRRRKQ